MAERLSAAARTADTAVMMGCPRREVVLEGEGCCSCSDEIDDEQSEEEQDDSAEGE